MIKILNIEVMSIYKSDLLKLILSSKGVIFTPNIDHLVRLQKDKEFYEIYKKAEFIICDSRIIQKISFLLGSGIKEAIPGSDLFPDFCIEASKYSEKKHKIFILGGTTNKITKKAKENINNFANNEIVVDYLSPPFNFEYDEEYLEMVVKRINDSKSNVLAVGLGSPKQEKLIFEIKNKLPNIELYFAIGATIDFLSGEVKRAPQWVQKLSLEWLYRLIQNPKRLIKRYLYDDPPFFFFVLKQKLGIYKNPF
jgi:N-acetylglucosaminyldiphosphoundecaprenol N-acetyl-beta-D-mannosaminyltransferase